MRSGSAVALAGAVLGWLAAPGAHAQALPPAPAGASPVDALLDRLDRGAPEPDGHVRLEAWVENGLSGGREVVITLEPQGEAKLIADPGITVTPAPRPGIEWAMPLPHRHLDPELEYFAPPATVRLPFAAADGLPIELQVEYAWCLLDWQCFFGEETLSVATRVE